jgi:anti-sigma B factor antagonist
MRISEHSDGQVTVLDLLSPLSGDFSRELFVPQIETLLEEGRRQFILNLSELPWINSTGVGLLLAARRKIGEVGGRAVLAAPNDRVKGILEVVGMKAIWEIHPTLASARASFQGLEAEESA